MTDIAQPSGPSAHHDWGSAKAKRRVRRRYGADRRLQFYGIGAITLAVLLLGVLLYSLGHSAYVAFYQTKVELAVNLDPAKIDASDPRKANYRKLAQDAFLSYFPDVTSRRERRNLKKIMSSGAPYILRDYVVAHPEKIGKTIKILVPLSDPFDQLQKRVIPRKIDALSYDRIELFERLTQRNVLLQQDGRTYVKVDVFIDPEVVKADDIEGSKFVTIAKEAFRSFFVKERTKAYEEILDDSAPATIKQLIADDPSLIGKTVSINLPVSKRFDELFRTGRAQTLNPRFASEKVLTWFDSLVDRGLIRTPFNWELFFNADSRFPELAGLAGAISGSFLALLICFLLSFPIGIATALYLEEFAPKNKWTDLIEVNINNLAAVPSVVFGLLGLAVFLNTFGLPRSVPLVGGMVLALMTLPTIIVATRAALKAVPPSIREAALGVGASKHQVMMHHVLPLAMPGILTGTIIGLAQALGETAPLLLIGMNAFIPSIENIGLLEPAMALPTQIFSWADSPERGFVSRTSAAIMVLLVFLIIMNLTAVYLRRRFERKW